MSFCKNCGREISQEAQFCISCGTPIQENNITTEKTIPETPKVKYTPKSIDNELLTPITGVERHFTLSNKKLIIPDDIDLFNAYRTKFREMAKVCSDNAVHEYLDNIHSFDTFINLFMEIYEKHLQVLTKKAFDILIAEEIYNISYEDFYKQHTTNFHLAIDDYNTIVESCRLTEESNNELNANVASTIQEAFTSFIGNKTSNSFVNSLANGYAEGILNNAVEEGTKINATQKAELYNRITPHILFNRIYCDYWNVYLSLTYILNQYGKHIFFPNAELAQQSNNVFANISNPSFNQDRVLEVLFEVVKSSPYNDKLYEFMEKKFGATDEVQYIKNYFGYNVVEDLYSEEDYPKIEEVVQTLASNENQGKNSILDKMNINKETMKKNIKIGVKSGIGKSLSDKFGKFL